MRTSDATTELLPALVAFATEVEDPTKGREANTGKYGYSYASLPDFLPMVRRLLAAHGLFLSQSVDSDGGGKGSRIITRVTHTSGQWLETDYPIAAITADSQKMGIAHTYARRYSLLQTLGLAPTEDDDGAGASGKKAVKPADKLQPDPRKGEWSDEERKRFCAALGGGGLKYDDVKAFAVEVLGTDKPSMWNEDGRGRFVADLGISWDAQGKSWRVRETPLLKQARGWIAANGGA